MAIRDMLNLFASKPLPLRLLSVALFAWPPLHYTLSEALCSDPWKLGGWAMYSTQSPRMVVEVSITDTNGETQRQPQVPDYAEETWKVFVEWRGAFGDLVKPDRVAAAIFDKRPAANAVSFRLLAFRFDGRVGRFREDRREYTFRRP
jgi:hypothetical protein